MKIYAAMLDDQIVGLYLTPQDAKIRAHRAYYSLRSKTGCAFEDAHILQFKLKGKSYKIGEGLYVTRANSESKTTKTRGEK